MTVRTLLGPLTPTWEVGEPPVFGDSPPAIDADDAIWSLRMVGWLHEWGELPENLEIVHIDGVNHCTGRLTRRSLDRWRRELHAAGHAEAATSLDVTLNAHLAPAPRWQWECDAGENGGNSWELDFSRPLVMGIVNVTDDSFSGDGVGVEEAITQGLRMAEEGADILDIGGESTRPGAGRVAVAAELARTIPVVEALGKWLNIPVSIDSSKPEVIAAALEHGAAMVNDVTALRGVADSAMARETMELLAARDCPIILMHMQGEPGTMQDAPKYGHAVSEVYDFLAERIEFCIANGIAKERLAVDSGIGFGKLAEHNLELLRRQRTLRGLGVPVLLGLSRKRIVGAMTGETVPENRDFGSNILAVLGYVSGAQIFRVHDVRGARQALDVAARWQKGLC